MNIRFSKHHNYGSAYGKQQKRRVIAFDLETRGLGGAIIEGAIGDDRELFFFSTIESLLGYMKLYAMTSEPLFLCHNGSTYEFTYLIQAIRHSPMRDEYDIFPISSGESIISVRLVHRYEDWTFELRDTKAVYNGTLARFSEYFCPPELRKIQTIDFEKETYDPENVEHRAYLQRDIVSLVVAYRTLQTMLWESFQCPTAMTAGSTAMKAWLHTIPEDYRYYRLNPIVEEFMREGYYGGYVSPGADMLPHADVISYDINGAYGARMRDEEYPVGNPYFSFDFEPTHLGMWRCHVIALHPPFPMCPFRHPEKGLYWMGVPLDECVTTITTQEVVFLREHGYRVDVLHGYFFNKSEPVFRTFVDNVEAVEGRGGAYKEIAKVLRNHLYGKFGARKEHERLIVCGEDHLPEGAIRYVHPITGDEIADMWTLYEEVDEPYMMPHWAAYITAYQRLALFKLILLIGPQNCLGCDTDSVKMPTDVFIEHLEELPPYAESFEDLEEGQSYYGTGKVEAAYSLYVSYGPKHYVYLEGDKPGIVCKGIPQKAMSADRLRAHLTSSLGGEIRFKSVTTALTMLRTDGDDRIVQERKRMLKGGNSEKWKVVDMRFQAETLHKGECPLFPHEFGDRFTV
jgi:DNA polymerase type B, organellar and viral